jgi:hypothetical protein
MNPSETKNQELKNQVFSASERTDVEVLKFRATTTREKKLDVLGLSPLIVFAGGYFASTLNDEIVKDIDIFVLDDGVKANRDYIMEEMLKRYPAVTQGTNEYIKANENIDSVWTDMYEKKSNVQYIYTKHKTREDLIKDFDYAHCTVSLYLNKLYISRVAYDAIKKKELIVNNPNRITKRREKKFIQRGYKYPADDFVPWMA